MKKSCLLGAVCACLGTYFGLVTSAHANLVPVVDAGLNQVLVEGQILTIDGSGTFDPDNSPDPLRYSWSQLSGPTINIVSSSTAITTVSQVDTIPVGGALVTLELLSFDGIDIGSDTVDILLKESNTAPIAAAGIDQTVSSGAFTTLDGSGSSDPDAVTFPGFDHLLTYSWAQISGDSVALSDPTAINPTFNAPATSQLLEFQLTLTDESLTSIIDIVQINVSAVPVPAAIWLFGSGLLGLIGIARRKAA